MQLVIKNGLVVMEEKTEITDVLIVNGVIERIGKCLSDGEVLDAAGKVVLPGGIDVHTHMDLDVGIAVAQDDFYTGTVAAACGGTTSIVDHVAFGPKGCSLDYQINRYHELARGKAVIDYGFHGVVQHVDADVLAGMESLMDEGITSFKIYMTYDYKIADGDIYTLLLRAKELGAMIAVHPENDGVVNQKRRDLIAQGHTAPVYHAHSRPEECEAEAINRVLQISAMAGDAPLYIVHLSNHLGMQYICMAKERGLRNVYTETCPQYLTLSDTAYLREDGLKFILSPPLRDKKNNALLWEDIQKGRVDTAATDHCPFDYVLKTKLGGNDFTKCPNGMPGVELRVPLLYSEGVQKNRITPGRFAKLCSTNPAKLFGLYPQKGVIQEGSDADIVILDPGKKSTITHAALHERVDYTPYEGMELLCAVDSVLSRGEVIVRGNTYIGNQARGKFLKRGKSLLSI